MPPRSSEPALPLPRGWREITGAGVLHAISLAAMAMTSAWSKASASRSSRQRASAEADRLRTETALLSEELELKDSRWVRVPARPTVLRAGSAHADPATESRTGMVGKAGGRTVHGD